MANGLVSLRSEAGRPIHHRQLAPDARRSWRLKAEDGAKLHVILDRYFDEGNRRWNILGAEFTNFRRTISTYIRTYRRDGFATEDIISLPTSSLSAWLQLPGYTGAS